MALFFNQHSDKRVFLYHDEFIKVQRPLEETLGRGIAKQLWDGWDTNVSVGSIEIKIHQLIAIAHIMRICRDTSILNPPKPYNGAIYSSDGIIPFQIPIENPVLEYENQKYRVDYIQLDRFTLTKV
jgi:hypothetical protein